MVRQRVKGPGPRFFRGFSLGGRDGMRSAGELMQFVRFSRFANVGHVRHFFCGLLLSFSCFVFGPLFLRDVMTGGATNSHSSGPNSVWCWSRTDSPPGVDLQGVRGHPRVRPGADPRYPARWPAEFGFLGCEGMGGAGGRVAVFG